MSGRLPGPGAAFGLFALALFLNFFLLGLLAFAASPDLAIILGEPLALLVPTLLLTRYLALDARETLRLRLPSGSDLLLAFPLAFSLAIINDQLSNLIGQIFPIDPDIQRGIIELLRAETTAQWILKVLGIGVGAAISEEILFRGFIQRGLERGLGRGRAIVVTSLLFAVMHLIPQGLPSYVLAGVVLGIVTVGSGSILVPIVIHFTNNVSSVALLNLAEMETLGRPIWIPPGILIPAVLIFGLTLTHYARKAASLPEIEIEPAPRPPAPPLAPADRRSIGEELEGVPLGRRRLGWLTVGCAVVVGGSVVLGLFGLFLYHVSAQQVHQAFIRELERQVSAAVPEDSPELAERVSAEFETLEAANEAGRVGFWGMAGVMMTYARAAADDRLEEREIERILDEVRLVSGAGARPRRL